VDRITDGIHIHTIEAAIENILDKRIMEMEGKTK